MSEVEIARTHRRFGPSFALLSYVGLPCLIHTNTPHTSHRHVANWLRNKPPRSFRIRFKSSDPDFSFDIPSDGLLLQVTLPGGYPEEPFTVRACHPSKELPTGCVLYVLVSCGSA